MRMERRCFIDVAVLRLLSCAAALIVGTMEAGREELGGVCSSRLGCITGHHRNRRTAALRMRTADTPYAEKPHSRRTTGDATHRTSKHGRSNERRRDS